MIQEAVNVRATPVDVRADGQSGPALRFASTIVNRGFGFKLQDTGKCDDVGTICSR